MKLIEYSLVERGSVKLLIKETIIQYPKKTN
jgi:hypothetical protein